MVEIFSLRKNDALAGAEITPKKIPQRCPAAGFFMSRCEAGQERVSTCINGSSGTVGICLRSRGARAAGATFSLTACTAWSFFGSVTAMVSPASRSRRSISAALACGAGAACTTGAATTGAEITGAATTGAVTTGAATTGAATTGAATTGAGDVACTGTSGSETVAAASCTTVCCATSAAG